MGTAPSLTPHRWEEAAVTPSVTVLIGCGPGAPSLDRSEGTTFLLSVPPARHRIGDVRDVRDIIEARCHTQAQSHTAKQRGGGATLDHFAPLAFGAAIRVAPYPRRFRPSMHISKYDGETNLDHWLEDYRLAMKAGGGGLMMASSSNTFPCFCQARPELDSSSSSPAAFAARAISVRSSSATSKVPIPA
jgi:hypothetical protein